jgi:uncharacterized delta-60 repeat protein
MRLCSSSIFDTVPSSNPFPLTTMNTSAFIFSLHNRRTLTSFWLCALLFVPAFADIAHAQWVADGFNPGANATVRAVAVQADGKILVGGDFTTLGGGGTGTTTRNYLGRLNADGSLDTSFNPGANAGVWALAVQPDGKILVGGGFTGLGGSPSTGWNPRNYIGQLNADGSLDTSFNPGANCWPSRCGTVFALVVQADGKILVGGDSFFGQLSATGSWNPSFDRSANSSVLTVAVQANGQILFGGGFTWLDGYATARNRIAPLNPNGSLDSNFGAGDGANSYVSALAVQSDGKILIGGGFSTLGFGSGLVGSAPRNYIGRLNANGSLDTSFNPGAGGPSWGGDVQALVVQADGKILVGGFFYTLGGGGTGTTARNHIGRLNADGSVDASFNPGANSTVKAFAMQADGKILVGGDFTTLGDGGTGTTTRNYIGRLTVAPPSAPAVTTHPSSRTATPDFTVSFSAEASGSPFPTVQWQVSTNSGATFTDITGATAETYSFVAGAADNGKQFRAVFTNSLGTATSSVAVVTVITLAGALDTTNLTWSTGGNTGWSAQTINTHDGVDAAQSGLITNSQESWIQTTVTNGPGTLTFWWKVSSDPAGGDELVFSLNGVRQGAISGEVDWQQQTFNLTAGTQTLRWTYSKDQEDWFTSQDKGWLDQVSFVPFVFTPPVITAQPINVIANAQQSATFTVTATGTPPLSYQWRKDGVNVTGATSASLTLSNVQTSQAGNYSVVITNDYGSATSSIASLTVVPLIALAEALDTTNLTWTTGGSTGWSGQTINTHDGVDAAQSGAITHNQESWMETTVTGPGRLSFWWKVSSEATYDYLEFYINGVRQSARISGEVNWQQQTFDLTGGSNVLRWRYFKDEATSTGQDRGWVDEVSLVPLPPGTVVAWGNNGNGQTSVPAGLSGVAAIACGGYHTVALNSDGTVVAWGENGNGQTSVPAGLSGVTAIAAGESHTVALKNNGTVVAWGKNNYGQTTVPAGLSGVATIAAGGNNSVALKTNGTIVAWGYNTDGQTTVPAGLSGVATIAAGGFHIVALKNNGTVVAWGYNGNGQTTVPAGLSGVTAIAAGWQHTVALKNNGTVVAWGMRGDGETTVPAGLSGVMAIAAGLYHTVALKNNGTVVAWGYNGNGQTSVPAGLSGVTAIAAGYYHTVALVGGAGGGVPPVIVDPLVSTVAVAPSSELLAGNEAVVMVTLLDALRNPVSGKTIKITVVETTGSGLPTVLSSVTQPLSSTDANGQATATFTSLTPGTVLVAAVDATDAIPLTQQPKINVVRTLVSPNNDLAQAIVGLYKASSSAIRENGQIGDRAVTYESQFRTALSTDTATTMLDFTFGVLGAISASADSLKYARVMALPGLEQTGVGPLIEDSGVISRLFDTELLDGIPSSRVLESAFREVAVEVVLTDIAGKKAAKVTAKDITDGLELIASQTSGISQLQQNINLTSQLFEQNLNAHEQTLLNQGVPPLSSTEQTGWATDLSLRSGVGTALLATLTQEYLFLGELSEAQKAVGEPGILMMIARWGAQALATVVWDGPGALVTGGLFTIADVYRDLQNVSADGTGYTTVFSVVSGNQQFGGQIFLNAHSGYDEILQAQTANSVTAEIGQMTDLEEGYHAVFGLWPWFSLTKSYSLVDLRNTSQEDATFEVIVLSGYDGSLYGLPIPGLSQVSITATNVPAGTEVQIPIVYFDGHNGGRPDPAMLMTVYILGNNRSGTFLDGHFTHTWNPSQTTTIGLSAYSPSSAERPRIGLQDNAPTITIENPVSCYISSNPTNQNYLARIFVTNPLIQACPAIVTQPLPPGITIVTTDGALGNSQIVWTNSIPGRGVIQDTFTFNASLTPGALTNLPPTSAVFLDPTGNRSSALVSVTPTFHGLFPLQASASIPIGVLGQAVPIHVALTNLTTALQQGFVTISLTNSSGSLVTNLQQSFSAGGSGSSDLAFDLPDSLLVGRYTLTGQLAVSGGVEQFLAGVYRVPFPPLTLTLAPQVQSLLASSIGLIFQGPVGFNYLLQTSSNLNTWLPIQYFTATSSPFSISVNTSTNSVQSFYRIAMP